MKQSSKYKAKIKKSILASVCSIAIVSATLATMELTGISEPLKNKINLFSYPKDGEKNIQETTSEVVKDMQTGIMPSSEAVSLNPKDVPEYNRDSVSTLDNILIDGEGINKYVYNKLNYKIFAESTSISVSVEKANEDQTVEGTGTITLTPKDNKQEQYFEIVVTSADGTNTSTYRIDYEFVSNAISTNNYDYIGDVQEYSTEKNAYYKVQLWGAAGGNVTRGYNSSNGAANGGKGGYTEGKIYLNAGTKLYVYVGEFYNGYKSTMSYNGGGSGSYSANGEYNANGGGATDIRFVKGEDWNDFDSLKSRVMVAAGGGGASNLYYGIQGGYAGGTNGGKGNYKRWSGSAPFTVAEGGTQTQGGLMGSGNPEASRGTMYQGAFGTGGYNKVYYTSWVYYSGGGGGYYGGGSGGANSSVVGSAGGGSSFISGYEGCNAISIESTKDNIIHTDQSIHYTGKYFINSKMLAGNQTMSDKSGTGTQTGNSGNGYATIKLLEEVSNNTNISSMITTAGTRLEDISDNRDTYTIKLTPNEYKVSLNITTQDPFSTINSEDSFEDIIVPVGGVTKTFKIVAEDGTSKTYTINFERQASDIAYIDGIIVNNRYYEFVSNVYEYNIELPYNEEYAEISANVIRPNQQIIGCGKYNIINDAGVTYLYITAEDGIHKETYTLNFTNEHCNYLKSIDIRGIALSEVFNPEKFQYKLALTSRFTDIEINTSLWDPEATVEINGNHGLVLGENEVTITVHEPNIEQDSIYTLIVEITNFIKYDYDYTGDYQSFVAPLSGYYKVGLWGAAGGNVTKGSYSDQGYASGGKGAYTEGEIYLDAGTVLYIYVGENYNGFKNTMSFNGGGSGSYSAHTEYNGNGGGATDIRLQKGETWSDFESLKSRIMVAAGGGGATNWYYGINGGNGGKLIAPNGNYRRADWTGSLVVAQGGTQTEGGLRASPNPESYSEIVYQGDFGIGGYNNYYYASWNYFSGGGGGYYGGGPGGAGTHIVGTGAGGSSFISGYDGCDAITEDSTKDNIIHTGQSTHYSGMTFRNAQMYAGDEIIPTKDGTSTQTGNTGNGYATIEYIEPKLSYVEKELILKENETYKIDKTKLKVVGNNDAIIQQVSYETTNENVVTVDDNGLITAVASGKAKIEIKDKENNLITYIYVTVCVNVPSKVESGSNFTIALKENGTVWSYGLNSKGQLGLGTNENKNTPTAVISEDGTSNLDKIKDIATGTSHVLALDESGHVLSWGDNIQGQLGLTEVEIIDNDGNTTTIQAKNVPTKITELENIIKIEAYKNVSYAIDKDKNLYVWGEGYSKTPTKIETDLKIVAVSGSIVLSEDGEVYNISDLINPIKNLSGISKISCGKDHYLALTASGIALSWGDNTYGELGITGSLGVGKIAEIIDNTFDISAGNDTSIFRTIEDKVYVTGLNSSGQIGLNATKSVNTKTLIETEEKFKYISAGEGTSSSLVDDKGFVWTTGLNTYGELGSEDNINKQVFEKIGKTQIITNPEDIIVQEGNTKDIVISSYNTFNLKTDIPEEQVNEVINIDTKKAKINLIANVDNSSITNILDMKPNFVVTAGVEGRIPVVVKDQVGNKRSIWINVVKDENAIVSSKVENGDEFSVVLKSNGEVYSWGKNIYGQLGLGDKLNRNVPEKIDILNNIVKDISVGASHTLLLTKDGKVFSFGLNANGQLGLGNVNNYQVPTQISSLTDIEKVIAKENTSFAINKYGEVYAWGDGYTKTPQKLDINENIVDIGKNYYLSDDGIVRKLTNNTNIQLCYNETLASEEPEIVQERIVGISEGKDHLLMLGESGIVYSYGQNTYGQLGDGTTIGRTSNITTAVRLSESEKLENIIKISAGERYSIALDKFGKVYTFGKNEAGELGFNYDVSLGGIQESLYAIAKEDLENIANIDAGYTHSTTSTKLGKVYTFGNGEYGELGNGANSDYSQAQLVGNNIINTNTNEVVMETGDTININALIEYFNLYKDETSNVTLEALDETRILVDNLSGNIMALKSGRTTIIAKEENTDKIAVIQVRILEEGTNPESNTIKIEPQVVTSGSHTITLRVDGTVWSYGQNSYGELGNGTTVYQDEPIQTIFPEGTFITKIATGEEHSLALDTSGNVWVWGRNEYYQLGNNTQEFTNTPIKLTGIPTIKDIECGNYNSFAIAENGEVYAWGLNANGECGIGSYTNKITITKVKYLTNCIDIKAGKNGTIALKSTGEVYTAGSNLYGELGNANTAVRKQNLFKQVDSLKNVVAIGAGTGNFIALDINSNVYAWGSNIYGELGLGETASSVSIPTKVNGINNIRYIDGGKNTSTLLDTNGNVYVAGLNKSGSLGNNSINDINSFEKISTISNVIGISQGNTYTVYLKDEGTVWASGDYNHGYDTYKSKTKGIVPIQVGNDKTGFKNNEVLVHVGEKVDLISEIEYEFNLINLNKDFRKNLKYESLKEEIATIQDGLVTGVKTGTTWVKAINARDNKVYVVKVNVIESPYITSPKVEAGENFATVLKGNGSIWTFGYNSNGQLSDGTYITRDIPQATNILSTYSEIAAGEKFFVALRSDKTVWATGSNEYGQLGNGSTKSINKLSQINGISDAEKIVAGKNHVLVLDSYGLLYGWGESLNGELGASNIGANTLSPVLIGTLNERIIDISAGNKQSIAVTANGKVYGMGNILNGYLNGMENAVKVEVGNGYLLILTDDNNIYKYENGKLISLGITDAIDISVKNNVNMYQSIDEKTYSWGENGQGQLGDNQTINTTSPKLVSAHGENTYSITSGYNNTYIIENTGSVYASGLNEYGALGNSTRDDSLTHTLVGDRKFEVVPENKVMTVNDIENPEIKSETFNVFENTNKDASEYEWKSDNEDVVLASNGELSAYNEGTAIITVTDKVTKDSITIQRYVQEIDKQRIDLITVNNVEAEASGFDPQEAETMTYKVQVKTDDEKGILVISTKDATDQISLDKDNWQEHIGVGTLAIEVELPNKITEIPIFIKTANGTILKYIVTVEKVSNDVGIKKISVTTGNDVINPTGEINATAVSLTRYEVVVPEETTVTLGKVVTNSDYAYVSIDGKKYTLNEQTKNLVIGSNLTKEVSIVIKSESGIEQEYTLVIYKESELANLEEVKVNNNIATKVSEGRYSITLDSKTNSADVYAKSVSNLVEVSIENNTYKKLENTNIIDITDNPQQVSIKLKLPNGDTKEYILEIYIEDEKQQLNLLDMLIVNGNVITQNSSGIYEAYLPSSEQTAVVRAIAKNANTTIQISTNAPEIGEAEAVVETKENVNTYKILVVSEENEEQEYTLIIKKAEADTSLKEIYIQNGAYVKNATRKDELIYEVKVPNEYSDFDVTAISGYVNAKISIDESEYLSSKATKNVVLSTENNITTVSIKIKSEDGLNETQYTLNIIRMSNDATLKSLKVDGIDATYNEKTKEYNISLQEAKRQVSIEAITNSEDAKVKINTNVYDKNLTTKDIVIDAKQVKANITVQAEDGTIKVYTLNIEGLSDNTNILNVEVNGVQATYKDGEAIYEVRLDSQNFNIVVTPEDLKATLKLGNEEEVIGIATTNVEKTGAETIVNLVVRSQNGLEEQSYKIIIKDKSNNNNLDTIVVNGIKANPDIDGNYTASIKQPDTSINIIATAEDDFAVTAIDGVTNNVKQMTKTQNTQEGIKIYTYTITVTSETGISKNYTLTVEWLEGNTDILEVDVSEDNSAFNAANLLEDGTYFAKVNRINTAYVKVPLASSLSSVTVNGIKMPTTGGVEIELSKEETKVSIIVTAQDGTTKDYVLNIVKKSNDMTLKEITGDAVISTKINTKDAYVYIDEDTKTFDLTYVLTNENGSIKLGQDSTYTNAQITRSYDLTSFTDKVLFIELNIMAENGETSTFIVYLTRQSNTNVGVVKVNEEEVPYDNINNKYLKVVANGDTPNVEITAENPLQTVELLTEDEATIIATGVGSISKTLTLDNVNLTQKYKIRITSHYGSGVAQDVYNFEIRQKSKENGIEYVKADNIEASMDVTEIIYNVNVSGKDTYPLEIKPRNENASIKLEDEAGNVIVDYKKGTLNNTISVEDGKTATYKVTVQSENGEEKLYTLNVTRISSNTNIEKIIVEDLVEVTSSDSDTGEDITTYVKQDVEVTNYNKATKTYSIIVNKDLDISNVVVKAASSFSKVSLDEEEYILEQSSLEKTLNGIGATIVKIQIKAADGTEETRYLKIIQLSDELSLKMVKIDDVEILPDDANNYEAIVTDEFKTSTIYAKTLNENAKVSINFENEKVNETTTIVNKETRQMIIPISVTAQDGTEYTYTLTLNIISHNSSTKLVKVDDVEADYVENVYQSFIDYDQENVNICIEAESEYSIIETSLPNGTTTNGVVVDSKTLENGNIVDTIQNKQILTFTITGLDLDTNEFEIPYKIIAEDGTITEETIKLIRKSTANGIEELYVNRVKIEADEKGNYYAKVSDKDRTALLKVIANNKYAEVEVEESSETQTLEKNVNIDTESKITKIEIKITSQQGDISIKTLTLERISADFGLKYVKVDNNEAELKQDQSGNYISYIYDNVTEVSIDIASNSEYAKIQQVVVDEETGQITTIRDMTRELKFDIDTSKQTTTIYFRIVAEDETSMSEIYSLDVEKMSTDATLKEIYVNGILIQKDENGKYIARILDTTGNPTIKAITNHELAHVRITLGEEALNIAQGQVTLSSEKETIVPITVRSQSGITKVTYLYIEVISTSVELDTVKVDDKAPNYYNEQTHTYNVVVSNEQEDYELFVMTMSNYANIQYDGTDYGSSIKQIIHMDKELQGKAITLTVTSESGQKQDYIIELVRQSSNTDLEYVKVDGIKREPTEPNGVNYEVMIGKKQKTAEIEVVTSLKYANIRLSDNEIVRNSERATIELNLEQDKIIVPVVVTAPDGVTIRTYNIVLVRGSNDTSIELKVNDKLVQADKEGDYAITLPETIEQINVIGSTDAVGVLGGVPKIDIYSTGIYEDGRKEITIQKEEIVGKERLTIPIVVIAEDGTKRENVLIITLQKGTYITGKITTENIKGEHTATITIVDSNSKSEVAKVQTNNDGTFKVLVYMTDKDNIVDIDNNGVPDKLEATYDVIVTKSGYLTYKVTNVKLTEAEETQAIDEYALIAGDVVSSGEIEIEDLVGLSDNVGVVIDETNRDTMAIFDLNEDGVVDTLDRNILKKNYSKKAETTTWVAPVKPVMMSMVRSMSEEVNGVTTDTQNFIIPLEGSYTVTSEYGYRVHPVTGVEKLHTGIDLTGEHHANILAVANGTVTYAGVQTGYGNCIEIKHEVNGETIYSFYAHLSQINVEVGDTIKQGDVIGLEGGATTDPNPGTSTGHHLHFEIRTASGSGNSVDPRNYIEF